MHHSEHANGLLLAGLLLALAVVGAIAAAAILLPGATQNRAYAQQATNTPPPPPPTSTPRPTPVPVCKFLIATSQDFGRSRNKPMEFTGTVGTSYFRPLRPGIDGQFDAVNAHGTAPCQWKATVNVPWLSMHRDSGTVPADNEHFAIRFNINDRARELRAGNHNAVIRFQVNDGKIYGA